MNHETFQHTSILKTVRERFGIEHPLSKREAAAASLGAIFEQKSPRKTPLTIPAPILPTLPPPDHHANPGNQWPDELQRDLLEGTFHATRLSHPEDDEHPPSVPSTQNALARTAHRRWSRHRRWQSETGAD